MTREEEITDAAMHYAYDIDKVFAPASFVAGAQWADAHPHWISVEDELPPMRNEDGMSDIVLTHSKRGVIYMNRYDYRDNAWGNPLAFNVTHWMPMPQAPESGCSEIPNNCKKGGEK